MYASANSCYTFSQFFIFSFSFMVLATLAINILLLVATLKSGQNCLGSRTTAGVLTEGLVQRNLLLHILKRQRN